MSSEKNLTFIGNKLQGMYIFDKHRQIFSEIEYFELQDEIEITQIEEIKKKDLVIGEEYELEDGRQGTYLGSKYISRVNSKNISENDILKIKKYYLFKYTSGYEIKSRGVDFLTKKVVKYIKTFKPYKRKY